LYSLNSKALPPPVFSFPLPPLLKHANPTAVFLTTFLWQNFKLGFQVVVIDDRKEYANPERFPEADKTIADDYSNVFSPIAINKFSYIVIVTRGHAHDQTVLEWAITTNAEYIGMIGSRNKIRKVYDNLIAKGVKEEDLKRVHAPIGLDIKAETPEEIAVSIMAEIIRVRHLEKPRLKPVCSA